MNSIDDEKAKLLRPKLSALRTFLYNVGIAWEDMPDNQTRKNYQDMYQDIETTLGDPNLEIYAPPLPHLGTTSEDATLWESHQIQIIGSGTRLINYVTGLLAQIPGEPNTPHRRLSCFLSYRFTDEAKKQADDVKHFLELLEIDVFTGDRYEPRSISTKVGELLSNRDFGILIVSSDEESIWTRDEVNSFWSENKSVIVLVMEGTSFTQGMQGDLEWIPFSEGHISDSFTKLLEGINFIRERLL